MSVKVREVVIQEVAEVLSPYRFCKILDAQTSEYLYHAAYKITCEDKAKRMGWKIVSTLR